MRKVLEVALAAALAVCAVAALAAAVDGTLRLLAAALCVAAVCAA